MAKRSPAPWHVRATSRPAKGYSHVADDGGEIIVTTHGKCHAGNAQLIALAPEMYDAISGVLSLRKYGDGGKRIAVLDSTTAKQLRSLLERAGWK